VIGIVAGPAVFAVNYARLDAIRASGTGASYASNGLRPPPQLRLLADHGDAIQVIRLQGYLFFGSAHQVLEGISARLALPGETGLGYLLLDFERVDGADSSTIFSFIRLIERADQRGVQVLFSALPDTGATALRSAGQDQASRAGPQTFPDLDHALESAEDALLATAPDEAASEESELNLPEVALGEEILAYGTRVRWRAGESGIRQGGQSAEMYFVEVRSPHRPPRSGRRGVTCACARSCPAP
jgi:sulfate permease, SulP family